MTDRAQGDKETIRQGQADRSSTATVRRPFRFVADNRIRDARDPTPAQVPRPVPSGIYPAQMPALFPKWNLAFSRPATEITLRGPMRNAKASWHQLVKALTDAPDPA